MNRDLIEILIAAAIAGFILFRLYTTLGKRTGGERPPQPAPAQGRWPREASPAGQDQGQTPAGPAGEGLMAILRVDPSFDAERFLTGARAAYDQIIAAFAKGDLEALRSLLTPRVYDAYAAAIAKRGETGEPGPELVRLKSAEIVGAALDGQTARVTVRYEAELAEGAHGVRDAREKWAFERNVRSANPNWLLARVTAA